MFNKASSAIHVSQPSRFISRFAWTLIILSIGLLIISIVQQVLLNAPTFAQSMHLIQTSPHWQTLPSSTKFLILNLKALSLALLSLALILLTSAIGLLKRKKWAWYLMMSFMILGVVINIAGLIAQYSFMPEASNASLLHSMTQGITTLLILGINTILSWIIWRLRSPEIAAEFQA